MHFQWYPGHMTKAKRAMEEDIKLIHVIIELVDARIPYSSKNPDIDKLANGKSRIILLNKADLADPAATKKWEQYYKEKGFFVLALNAKNKQGMKAVHDVIKEACKEKIERDRRRGIKNRPVRAMIVGIPNVGKSTFINSFAGKACTKTGNKPGVTKGKQWIHLNKSVELLDTPGILWPKFEDQSVGLRLAFIGSIKDELLNIRELSMELIDYLTQRYPGYMKDAYHLDQEAEKSADNLIAVAQARNCLKTGGEMDYDKASKLILDEYRAGKLGQITLEFPEDMK